MASQFLLNVKQESTYDITSHLMFEMQLELLILILWDKIPSTSKYSLEVVDRLFRDVCKSNKIL